MRPASVSAWSYRAWRRRPRARRCIVSRAAPELVSHLFQTEVPEIYDNTVVIRAIAREAGERTKIAVMSKDKDVDPVGACVGMKGMRVQSIIRELRGEKIDIIEYHEDPVTFAEKALQPAKVSRVTVARRPREASGSHRGRQPVSLAIGKKGQNVRLAAKLLGWKIDIKSEEEKRQEVEEQMQSLVGNSATSAGKHCADLGDPVLEKLSLPALPPSRSLADMTPEELEEVPGIGPETVEKISIAVNNYFASLDAAEAVPAEGEVLAEGEMPAEGEVLAEVKFWPKVKRRPKASLSPEMTGRWRSDWPGCSCRRRGPRVRGRGSCEDGAEAGEAADESDVEPGDEGGQSGDDEGLPDVPEADSESVEDWRTKVRLSRPRLSMASRTRRSPMSARRIIHERPETPNENVPDEEEPGRKPIKVASSQWPVVRSPVASRQWPVISSQIVSGELGGEGHTCHFATLYEPWQTSRAAARWV